MFRSATKSVLNTARQTVSRATVRPVIARAYHENVISHYEKPRNVNARFFFNSRLLLSDNTFSSPIQVGSLPKGDIDVGTGLVGAPAYVSPAVRPCSRVNLMFHLQLRRRHETTNPCQ
jgi:iron-sulfur cluster assembly enzyme ISCU, mitochondrial